MIDDWFEWDDAKAASNLLKHGVSFPEATLVFKDENALEELDDRFESTEDRWIVVGMSYGRLLVVIYTERHERIPLISARRSENIPMPSSPAQS